MSNLSIHNLHLATLALALVALWPAHVAEAASLSTTVTWIPSGSFWFEAADMQYVTGGSGAAFGGTGHLMCISAFLDDPQDGENHTYEVVTAADIFAHASGANRGEDLVHWLYDNYYDAWFISGDPAGDDYANTGLFQNTLWEIAEDFDGDASSLSDTAGSIQLDLIPGFADAVPSISTGYRSSLYQLQFLSDTPPYDTDQNMVLATALSVPIPEPTSLSILASLGAVATLAWGRRSQRTIDSHTHR